jgi:diguanylate cyclase (GGDEF)-like protein
MAVQPPHTRAPVGEPRETNGLTSRLMLSYAEREGGREAVEALLRVAGLAGREEELRDENSWFSLETKLRLFEALAEVLDDPDATYRAGANVLEFNVGDGLKVALRALGSPRIVYQQVVRANAKFSSRHGMELLELEPTRARVSFRDLTGGDIHPLDCRYTEGLLSCVPAVFGRPPARISHPVCAAQGAECCIFDVSWQAAGVSTRSHVAAGIAAAAAIGASALAAPSLLPEALGATAMLAGLVGWQSTRAARAKVQRLQTEADDAAAAGERLRGSLEDLVSELRLEELLDKVVHNARVAVGGKEFALLVREEHGLACGAATSLPADAIAVLERWAADAVGAGDPVLVEDVAVVPALRELPMRSVCAAPLLYRGEIVGVLVALANQPRTFLPLDVHLVRSYAAQAAIALANARLFAAQHALATRDALTGVFNHREFHEALDRELSRSARSGSPTTVVLFDLDGFKAVNDASGHARGDEVLRGTAAALDAACREGDLAFRLGGDEFALLLPDTAPADASVVADRAAAAIARVDERITTSYGIAGWPSDGDSKDVLLAQGDNRLYAMKGTRRFSDEVEVLEAMAAQVAARLERARRRAA